MASPLEDMIEEMQKAELQSTDGDAALSKNNDEDDEEETKRIYQANSSEPNYKRNNNDQGY